jgi:hypothetical protein
MAQQSRRRDRENQTVTTRLERAALIWTRSADSHTGLRPVRGRMRGRTHVSTRRRAAPIQKILLAPVGASTHVTGTAAGLDRRVIGPGHAGHFLCATPYPARDAPARGDSNGSSRLARPSPFSRCMLRFTTRSMFNATLFPALRFGSSEPRPCRYGGLRPLQSDRRCHPGACDLDQFPRQSPATKERTLSPRGNLAAGSPGSRLPA